jgi:hypothetical protein
MSEEPRASVGTVVFALVLLVAGLVFLLNAAPGEKRVLVFDGYVVEPDDQCTVYDFNFDDVDESEDGDCRDVAEYETRHVGWDSGGATLGGMLLGLGTLFLFASRSAARR